MDLLEAKLRSTATRLLGVESLLSDAITSQLTNEVLLRALDFTVGRRVESFYTEIDLAPGQLSSQILFQATFQPKVERGRFTPAQWSQFISTREALLRAVSVDITQDSLASVEAKYEELRKLHFRWEDQHGILLAHHKEACNIEKEAGNRVDMRQKFFGDAVV